MLSLVPALAERYRVIAPDLPGFGASTPKISDYSVRAHARYVAAMLDALGVGRAHVVAFSMVGGVALNLADIAPERVASVTMLSAIGVQEMELLGDYHLNHALHALQLAFVWGLAEATPHFGLLDGSAFGNAYARNFYDTDQRPLRAMLERFEAPMLVVHGRRDPLVPLEAALEHHRIVPQSELALIDDDHFMVYTNGDTPARSVAAFVDRVERGDAVTRSTAAPSRLAAAAAPYDPRTAPRAMGVAALVVGALLAGATLVSEDLACIGAGVMAANGRISFLLAAAACLVGIFVGDVLLFLAGRYFGRAALGRAPLKWFLGAAEVDRCSRWFAERGAAAIFISRFVPGARLPTYFAAGLFDTSVWRFSAYFLVAAAVWTPALVALSMLLGGEVVQERLLGSAGVLSGTAVAVATTYGLVRLGMAATTFRGRRLLAGAWRRRVQWEFWPPWLFYPPVVAYVAWLAVRYRGLTVFTAANPAIADGGFVGESKAEILAGLGPGPEVARWTRVSAALPPGDRDAAARAFLDEEGIELPVVVKPDVGQRGEGVSICRSPGALEEALAAARGDAIVQEFAPGVEFGVFYVRRPGEHRGWIFSITDKQFPEVAGDGSSTLERLILADDRAVCMARVYFDRLADRLAEVPAAGERVRLVDIGTHCRGAVFVDGARVRTEALEEAIDRLASRYDGFYFGRFDIRAESAEAFADGRAFKVVELNGVTSEATHIYDPSTSLVEAYRVIFAQWRLAFEIGAANRARGHRPIRARALATRIGSFLSR
jgi:pimeloyl-ACP methyl ester carboxylesterase/membrane protein DedA with SNARE-associated domain